MTAVFYAIPVLALAGCAYAWTRLTRNRRDRPTRPLTLRERAQWRHITRAFARDAELDELRAILTRLEQDGTGDVR